MVTGPTSDRLSAVDVGRIEATILTPSELPRARKQGSRRTAKPELFVDLSLLQQLEKEGFMAEMAKRYP